MGLLVVAIVVDFVTARSAHVTAQAELSTQQARYKQMQAVNQEQAELQKKMNDIQARIDVIQKLKSEQEGPGNLLREIKDRFDGVQGLYLKSVTLTEKKEKGPGYNELVIIGESPNEASVTRFGQSLEFSSGLFSDLSIFTQREVAKAQYTVLPASSQATLTQSPVEVVNFTVTCNYNAPKPPSPTASPAASPAPNAAGSQVAKN